MVCAEETLKMKKQKTQMLVLGVLLVLCAAGYLLAARISEKKEAKEQQKEEGEYTALSFDQSELTQLQITSESGTLGLSYDGENWSFIEDIDALMSADESEDESSESQTEENTSYEVNASKANEISAALSNLTCTNEITDVSDLSQYGLDEPSATIQITLSDGTEHTVEIGSENTMISCWYIRADESDVVYTIKESTYELFLQTDKDVAQEAAE
jgi:hypothetical protein